MRACSCMGRQVSQGKVSLARRMCVYCATVTRVSCISVSTHLVYACGWQRCLNGSMRSDDATVMGLQHTMLQWICACIGIIFLNKNHEIGNSVNTYPILTIFVWIHIRIVWEDHIWHQIWPKVLKKVFLFFGTCHILSTVSYCAAMHSSPALVIWVLGNAVIGTNWISSTNHNFVNNEPISSCKMSIESECCSREVYIIISFIQFADALIIIMPQVIICHISLIM